MSRVRATDPRPCPKCGKIYRSAHTLRTHLEDKHTICPGYRCVLCGTVAKSRNSLHSHMSRQHRGISTKDLPVLPMPSPFDPELASRLLAKAGVKISPAELRARASPTGQRRSDIKLDAKSAYSGAPSETSSICGDNDPEDLTISSQPRYSLDLTSATSPPNMNHLNTTITKINMKPTINSSSGTLTPTNQQAIAMKSIDYSNKDLTSYPSPLALPPPTSQSTGSAILDTYLQMIAENSLTMGMTSEQAIAAVQAAKLAQLNAMNLDKVTQHHFMEKMSQVSQVNDFSLKRHHSMDPPSHNIHRNDDEFRSNDDNGYKEGGIDMSMMEPGSDASDDDYSDTEDVHEEEREAAENKVAE